jgi:hypothetical protein
MRPKSDCRTTSFVPFADGSAWGVVEAVVAPVGGDAPGSSSASLHPTTASVTRREIVGILSATYTESREAAKRYERLNVTVA